MVSSEVPTQSQYLKLGSIYSEKHSAVASVAGTQGNKDFARPWDILWIFSVETRSYLKINLKIQVTTHLLSRCSWVARTAPGEGFGSIALFFQSWSMFYIEKKLILTWTTNEISPYMTSFFSVSKLPVFLCFMNEEKSQSVIFGKGFLFLVLRDSEATCVAWGKLCSRKYKLRSPEEWWAFLSAEPSLQTCALFPVFIR